jgi:hypothetical protein
MARTFLVFTFICVIASKLISQVDFAHVSSMIAGPPWSTNLLWASCSLS